MKNIVPDDMVIKAAKDANLSQVIQVIIWEHAGEGNKYKDALAASMRIIDLFKEEKDE